MSLKRFTKEKESILVMSKSDMAMGAIAEMIEQRYGATVIASAEGKLEGIFTEWDVLTKIVNQDNDPRTTPLGEIMTTNPVKIDIEESLDAAIHCMQVNQISHLPITEDGDTIVGMITLRHLLHDKIRDLVNELHEMEAYLNDAPGG